MKLFIFFVILMLLPSHTFYLNSILEQTNKGRIWKKTMSMADKRAAAISLANVSTFFTFLIIWYLFFILFG